MKKRNKRECTDEDTKIFKARILISTRKKEKNNFQRFFSLYSKTTQINYTITKENYVKILNCKQQAETSQNKKKLSLCACNETKENDSMRRR